MRTETIRMAKIVRDVQNEMLPAEDTFDTALGGVGKLLHSICEKRVEAQLPMSVAQDAIRLLAAATMKIGEARGDFIAAHRSLAADAARLIPELGWGDGSECPPASAFETGAPVLRAIA